jgi:hypothetical protein
MEFNRSCSLLQAFDTSKAFFVEKRIVRRERGEYRLGMGGRCHGEYLIETLPMKSPILRHLVSYKMGKNAPISKQSGHILGESKTAENLASVCRISVEEYSNKNHRSSN